jgi:glycosyltransferase involved in cell wall biosynthesis
MKLSIIIPTLNEAEVLPRLLESIRKQDFSDYEIIVPDANSDDNTREIAEKEGCKVIEGGKLAYGRNHGAKKSKGNLLLFIDADVVLPPNSLKSLVREFEKRKLDIGGTLQKPIKKRKRYNFYYGAANLWMKIMANTSKPYMQVCMFVKKEVFSETKGFDNNLVFGEDSEYACRAVREGYKFGILKNKILIDTRRFEKETSLPLKYLYLNLLRLFGKEFYGGINYDYDY